MSTFEGTPRFELLQRLGAGGFGTVYSARDRTSDELVALKLLHRRDADALRRFKAEFRTLADVSHANLVSLFELHQQDGDWFFTMEYVPGVGFRDWVAPELAGQGGPADAPRAAWSDASSRSQVLTRPARPRALPTPEDGTEEPPAAWRDTTAVAPVDGRAPEPDFADVPTFEPSAAAPIAAPTEDRSDAPIGAPRPTHHERRPLVSFHGISPPDDAARTRWAATMPPRGARPCPAPDAQRLRDAFRQLAEGLTWLHGAGKLHRDVKPSNVRVTPDGRVVVLDFGLVTRLTALDPTIRDPLIGTPLYMAPEIGAGHPATPASDWYSVGVMLYLALTGDLPFRGAPQPVLLAKQALDPIPPGELAAGVPDDLDELARRLLDRNPRMRPTADAILYALGWQPSARVQAPIRPKATAAFVGRDADRDAIAHGLERALTGGQAVRLVAGVSGMGKSALCDHALAPADADPRCVVLRSRCYERGSVQYRALDGAIDDASRLLANLDAAVARRIMPPDADALARLFPVLGADPEAAPIPAAGDRDAASLKRRAYGALRELFTRLATVRTVVIYIDDLQWGDEDSLAPLAELLRPPHAPPLLLVGAYRSDERESSPFLVKFLAPSGPLRGVDDRRSIELGPLTEQAALELALSVTDDHDRAGAIVDDAGGSPFLITELARHARRASPTPGGRAQIDGDALLVARTRGLDEDARRFIEVVSVAGEPIPSRLAHAIAPLERRAFHHLERDHLVRAIPGEAQGEAVAPYHDRVRESVTASLEDSARAALHLALAERGREMGAVDDEFLATHFRRGERALEAHHHTLLAAERAEAALAFDRAAALYRGALELSVTRTPQETRALIERLAEALRRAGRGLEAARAYLDAAEGRSDAEARALDFKAAEQLLFAGAFGEGEVVIRRVLGEVGVTVARGTAGSMASFGWHTLRMKLRGLKFVPRPPEERGDSRLVDILWSATIGMSMASPLASQALQQRHLRAALDSGDPYRAMRALSIELAFSGLPGGADESRSQALSERAHAVAATINHPYAEAFVTMSDGAVHWLRGRWAKAKAACDAATTIYETECAGVTWEQDTGRFVILDALAHLGDLNALRERLAVLLADARERGDLYAETQLVTRFAWLMALADDAADDGRAEIDRAREGWTASGFQIVDFWTLIGRVTTALYARDATEAEAVVERAKKPLKRSFMLMGQYYRVHHADLVGRVGMARALELTPDTRPWRHALRDISAVATGLIREEMPWATPFGARLEGLVAAHRGDEATAIARLAAAAEGFARVEMAHEAAATRWARGALPHDGAHVDREAARAWASAQGVRDPDRFLWCWAPIGTRPDDR